MQEFAISKFSDVHAQRLSAFATRSERLAQLAKSHPLAFFAIATEYGPEDRRADAVRRVERGDALRNVCEALAIPHALRRVPPQALRGTLTYANFTTRAGQVMGIRLDNISCPTEKWRALQAGFYGARVCDEEFGMWLSGPRVVGRLPRPLSQIRTLALYAWASRRDRITPKMPCRPWSSRQNWGTALHHAHRWIDALSSMFTLATRPLTLGPEPRLCWATTSFRSALPRP